MTHLPDLDALGRDGLAALWAAHLGGAVPRQMSQTMQRRFIAFALQVRAQGDVAPAHAARFERIAAGDAPKAAPTLKPGARLLRAWNGTTHVVDVVEGSYLWNGTRHRSLSAIARAITGARWSGPRFFGVVEPKEAAASPASSRRGRGAPVPAGGRARQTPLSTAAAERGHGRQGDRVPTNRPGGPTP